MKYKYILAVTILSFSVLMFNGCGKNDAEPVTSETIEESVNTEESGETEEIEEPDQGINEGVAIDRETSGEESTIGGSSVEVSGETVGNTTLTQEEIDALKEQASDMDAEWIDGYQSIIEDGSWTDSDGTVFKSVVGTPGDTSWRRMTDAEAQAIINKGKPDPWDNPDGHLEYKAAEAELSNGTWSSYVGSTIYFDYYQYKEDSAKANEQWRADHADELGSDEIITEDDIILY